VYGLENDALEIIESIAHKVMDHFGYKTHLVGVSMEPKVFTNEEIVEFLRLNQVGIDKMNENLKIEDVSTITSKNVDATYLTKTIFRSRVISSAARTRQQRLTFPWNLSGIGRKAIDSRTRRTISVNAFSLIWNWSRD
jgi:hypothetical protein